MQEVRSERDWRLQGGGRVGGQLQMVVCRMTLEIKRKRMKAEPRIKWWKLKKEVC